MKNLTKVLLILVFAVFVAGAVYADDDEKIKKHPGYIDFESIEIPTDAEETVEVYVKGPLLKLVASATRNEDPALSEMLSDLLLVRVNTFSIDPGMLKTLRPKMDNIEKNLQKQKWEKIVKVKKQDEHVNIYLKFDNSDKIVGLVVMAVEADDEAVFVNIVGTIDWNNIAKLGKKFNIDELEGLDNSDKPDKK